MNVRQLLVSLMLSLVGGCDAVVGGQCADGYEACGGACVPAGACQLLLPRCPAGAATAEAVDAGADETPKPVCSDVTADPLNCGACGNVCATGVCSGGACVGARSGDAIVIGHDFVGAVPGLAMSEVVVNAVFMRGRSPVRVLSWQQYADPGAIVGVARVLDGEAARSGRTYTNTVASSGGELGARAQASDFDVVLVLDQAKAAPGALATHGEALAEPLRRYAEDGGVVVVLDGGGGTGEMPRFVASAGLADVLLHNDASSTMLDVVAPTDAVGSGVMTPYKALGATVSLTLGGAVDDLSTVVAEPMSGRPVVLHRVVRRK